MAKRHHNSERSRDMGHDMRREMSRHSRDGMHAMKEGGGMIHDDRSQPCNLPSGVMDKHYGMGTRGMGGSINDLYMGVQKQTQRDASDLSRELKPGKY